jgi:hypothetical protein
MEYHRAVPHKIQCTQRCTMAALEWASINRHRVSVYGSYAANAYTARLARRPTRDVDIAVACSNEVEFISICDMFLSYINGYMAPLQPTIHSHYSRAQNSARHARPTTLVVKCMGEPAADLTMMGYDIVADSRPAVVPWDSVGMASVDGTYPCFSLNIFSLRRILAACSAVATDASNFRRERDAYDIARMRLLAAKRLMSDQPIGPFEDGPVPSPPSSPCDAASGGATWDAASVVSSFSDSPRLVQQGAVAACTVLRRNVSLDISTACSSSIRAASKSELRHSQGIAACSVACQPRPQLTALAHDMKRIVEKMSGDMEQRFEEWHKRAERERELTIRFSRACLLAAEKQRIKSEEAIRVAAESVSRSCPLPMSTRRMVERTRDMLVDLACTGCFYGSHDLVAVIDAWTAARAAPPADGGDMAEFMFAMLSICTRAVAAAAGHALRADAPPRDARAALPVSLADRICSRMQTPPLAATLTTDKIQLLEQAFVQQTLLTPGTVTVPTEEGGRPEDNAWTMMRMVCAAIAFSIDEEKRRSQTDMERVASVSTGSAVHSAAITQASQKMSMQTPTKARKR